jgi:2-C-methyl-D-erythritol 4-phosphate cytidylyltransferase
VIPAAGSGARMAASVPKQYLPLCGKTVLQHTLERLLDYPRIAAVALVLAPGDAHWPRLADRYAGRPLITARGGAERSHSVLNGLRALAERASPRDWVLVHDAARPCIRREDLDTLLQRLHDHPVGGLLGIPVADTKKRVDRGGNIIETVARHDLWRALTPQMFRYQALLHALEAALEQGRTVTDESSAMELAGEVPRIVEGRADNIKITRPQDLALAEWYLRQQEEVG